MEEIWKDIPGWEGFYAASNYGRIKSLDRTVDRSNGTSAMLNGKILKLRLNHNGYYDVCLGRNRYRVNRLVWKAFNGTIPEGMQVNHINEIRTDNAIWNLSLASPKENSNWGTRNEKLKGYDTKRERKWVIKLNTNNEILHFYPSLREAERSTGISNAHISECCRGKIKTAGGYIWKYTM